MGIKTLLLSLVGFVIVTLASIANASLIIQIYSVSNGAHLGYVKADDTIYGLLLTPKLRGLSPGVHGFHVHECPDCSNHGLDAGGHLDPTKSEHHVGPYRGNGHLGDLPVLIVDEFGRAKLPVLAPRLRLESIKGHALMIDSGGDSYSDQPCDGGGRMRIACGEIKYFN